MIALWPVGLGIALLIALAIWVVYRRRRLAPSVLERDPILPSTLNLETVDLPSTAGAGLTDQPPEALAPLPFWQGHVSAPVEQIAGDERLSSLDQFMMGPDTPANLPPANDEPDSYEGLDLDWEGLLATHQDSAAANTDPTAPRRDLLTQLDQLGPTAQWPVDTSMVVPIDPVSTTAPVTLPPESDKPTTAGFVRLAHDEDISPAVVRATDSVATVADLPTEPLHDRPGDSWWQRLFGRFLGRHEAPTEEVEGDATSARSPDHTNVLPAVVLPPFSSATLSDTRQLGLTDVDQDGWLDLDLPPVISEATETPPPRPVDVPSTPAPAPAETSLVATEATSAAMGAVPTSVWWRRLVDRLRGRTAAVVDSPQGDPAVSTTLAWPMPPVAESALVNPAVAGPDRHLALPPAIQPALVGSTPGAVQTASSVAITRASSQLVADQGEVGSVTTEVWWRSWWRRFVVRQRRTPVPAVGPMADEPFALTEGSVVNATKLTVGGSLFEVRIDQPHLDAAAASMAEQEAAVDAANLHQSLIIGSIWWPTDAETERWIALHPRRSMVQHLHSRLRAIARLAAVGALLLTVVLFVPPLKIWFASSPPSTEISLPALSTAGPTALLTPAPTPSPTPSPRPTLRLDNAEVYKVARAALPPCLNRANCGLYQTQKGDYIRRVASAFGLSADDLAAYNPQLTSLDLLYSGTELFIPR